LNPFSSPLSLRFNYLIVKIFLAFCFSHQLLYFFPFSSNSRKPLQLMFSPFFALPDNLQSKYLQISSINVSYWFYWFDAFKNISRNP
jgi:hypothetical protein